MRHVSPNVLAFSVANLCFWEGTKELDHRYDFWDDVKLDELDGDLSDHADETEFEDGFMWSCCEKPISSTGCVASEHEVAFVAEKKKVKKVKRSDSVVL